jgi:hypothetical protein
MRIALVLLTLTVTVLPLPAQAQRTYWHAGNFRYLPSTSGELVTFVDGLAHPNAGGYGKVSSTRAAAFNTFLDTLFAALQESFADGNTGDWCGVQRSAASAGYAVRRFYDTATGRWFVYGYDTSAYGQAYFFINPYAKRNLIIEVPHEPYDLGTGSQGARLFTALAARVLIINKEHRCSDPDATSCSGTTSACGGYFRESDVAHHDQNTLHLLHKWLNDRDSATRFVQLHGMAGSSSDIAEAADATTNDYDPGSVSVRFITSLKQYVPNGSTVHSCQESVGAPPSNLCATTNLQGRYTNDSSLNACTTSTSFASNRFLHLEQHATLRDNDHSDGYSWSNVRDALWDTWPTCDLNNGSTDCTVGPSQIQYSNLSCP